MNDLQIRDARRNDREAIREVTLDAYQEYAAQLPVHWEGYRQNILATLAIECVQMDPLNVIARSHDLALWGRVVNCQPDHLETLMYRDRQFFDYGSHLRIYP